MAINLMGKVIKFGYENQFFNVLIPIKSLKQLIQASEELINQGARFHSELSYEISTESIFCIFKPNNAPNIILELPVKFKPYSDKFRKYETKCRELFEQYFRAKNLNP